MFVHQFLCINFGIKHGDVQARASEKTSINKELGCHENFQTYGLLRVGNE